MIRLESILVIIHVNNQIVLKSTLQDFTILYTINANTFFYQKAFQDTLWGFWHLAKDKRCAEVLTAKVGVRSLCTVFFSGLGMVLLPGARHSPYGNSSYKYIWSQSNILLVGAPDLESCMQTGGQSWDFIDPSGSVRQVCWGKSSA